MPSRELVEKTLRTHFEAWNAGDRQRWLDNWRDDAVLCDPVGGPEKRGRAALERTWERSFQPGHHWRIEPLFMQVCQDQAALHVRNRGTIDGEAIELDSIEIYWVDDAGKLARVQTYFSPPEGRTLDPFFMPAESQPTPS
jgi:ketosteroid isomerase-like protein